MSPSKYLSIDEYISDFPPEIQHILRKLRQTIKQVVPEATEGIHYGMPTFDLYGKHLIYFACWKQHVSVYPLPTGDTIFQQEIAKYTRSKGTIQFPLDSPIPYEFVAKIVRFLLKEKINMS